MTIDTLTVVEVLMVSVTIWVMVLVTVTVWIICQSRHAEGRRVIDRTGQ